MDKKKGYVLAITFVIMLFVLILSFVILLIVQTTSTSKNTNDKLLNIKMSVKEITNKYLVLSESDFISTLQADDYEYQSNDNIISLNNNSTNTTIKIDKTETNKEQFFVYINNVSFAKIIKESGSIVKFKYNF